MEIKITTDSAADLPIELYEKYKISVIPLRVYDEEGNEYFDGETLTTLELFNDMKKGKVYKTSLPAYESIKKVLESYALNNTALIHLSLTGELSGTHQAVKLVLTELKEKYPDWDAEIFDTKCGSIGEGIIVIEAAKLAKEGASKEVVLNHIQFLSNHMEHIFTVADLQYFVRGGRVSKFQGFIGGLLNIKPILHLKDGLLTPIEKLRGSKKTFERILSIIEERGEDLKNQTIGIAHADNIQVANLLKEAITKRFGCDKFIINSIGAVIGAHAGPGAYGVFFLNKKR